MTGQVNLWRIPEYMEKTTDFINLWQTLSHNQYTLITTDRSQTQNNEVVSGIDCISELEVDNFNCIFRQCCEEEKSRKFCSVSTQRSLRHKFKIEWKYIFHYIVFVLFLLFWWRSDSPSEGSKVRRSNSPIVQRSNSPKVG
jgi:hypothetical protein